MGKEIKGAEKKVKVVGKPPHWGVELTKKGVFNFEKLYKFFMGWFDEHKYDTHEKQYTSKPLVPQGEEIVVEYSGLRDVSKYFRFHIDVEIWGVRLKKVGRDYKGNIKVRFRGWIEKDPNKKWRNFEFLRQIYDLYIIKNKISKYKDKVKNETNNLIKKAKKILSLVTK